MTANGLGGSDETTPRQASGPGRDWLYPIVDGSGRFEGPDRRYRAEFEAYRRAAMTSRLLRGDGPLTAGFRSIREGDVFWLYAGDAVGVVGRAIVRDVAGRPEPRVRFTLDRPASRLLAQDPVPGTFVRRSLSRPAHGPVSLVEHAGLAQGLEWWVELLDERDQRRLEPLGVGTLRGAIARNAALLKDPSLAALVRTLRSFDLALGAHVPRTGTAYVLGLNEDELVVGCLVAGGQGVTPSPATLGSVASAEWYGWSLLDQAAATVELHQWFTFSRTPHAQLVRFLEDADHSVSWYQSGHLELGPRTRLRWSPVLDRQPAVPVRRSRIRHEDARDEPVSFRRETATNAPAWAHARGDPGARRVTIVRPPG